MNSLSTSGIIARLPLDPLNNATYHIESEEDPPVGVMLYVKLESQTQNQFGCGASSIYRLRVGNYTLDGRECRSW